MESVQVMIRDIEDGIRSLMSHTTAEALKGKADGFIAGVLEAEDRYDTDYVDLAFVLAGLRKLKVKTPDRGIVEWAIAVGYNSFMDFLRQKFPGRDPFMLIQLSSLPERLPIPWAVMRRLKRTKALMLASHNRWCVKNGRDAQLQKFVELALDDKTSVMKLGQAIHKEFEDRLGEAVHKRYFNIGESDRQLLQNTRRLLARMEGERKLPPIAKTLSVLTDTYLAAEVEPENRRQVIAVVEGSDEGARERLQTLRADMIVKLWKLLSLDTMEKVFQRIYGLYETKKKGVPI